VHQLFITFGLPGAGKTYVARVFEDFGFHFHDGDDDLTEAMRLAIETKSPIDDSMRDTFFERIYASIDRLLPLYSHLVVAQTFIKEKYRRRLLERFPQARFILVEADEAIREQRLIARTHQALDLDYARNMTRIFEPTSIPYAVINNDSDGHAEIHRQIAAILGLS
jgi:gluconate kinase